VPLRAASHLHLTVLMFGFFSSRLGCLGSLLVSIAGTILLMLLTRACTSTSAW
jgi:hypothetical protein